MKNKTTSTTLSTIIALAMMAMSAYSQYDAFSAAQMKDKRSEESRQAGQFSYIGKHLQAAIFGTTEASSQPLIPTLGNYPNTTVAVGANTIPNPEKIAFESNRDGNREIYAKKGSSHNLDWVQFKL